MVQQRKLDVVLDSVKRLLRVGATANLLNLLQKQHPADLAQVFSSLQDRERRASFTLLLERNSKLAMEALSEIGPETAAALLADRSAEEIARFVQELPSDDAAAIIDNLPEDLSASVLDLMRRKESASVENLLEYPEQTAGRIMNPNVFALSEELTVGEAITELQSSRDVEMVFYLYVVDVRRHLVGVVSLRRLLLVSPETPLKRIMTADLISVRVDTDQEEVAQQVASYNLLAIPVVEEENKLVGVITVDDVIDVIKDEATEDIYRLAGVAGDERAFTPPGESVRKRLPWLAVNLVTAFLAAFVVGSLRGDDRQGRGARRVHADRGGHGRQRRDADADRRRTRHRAGRVVVGELAESAAEGGRGRYRERRGPGAACGGHGVDDEGRPCARRRARAGDGDQHVRRGDRGDADSAGAAGAQNRSGARLVRVHHHADGYGGVCVVPWAGNGVSPVLAP